MAGNSRRRILTLKTRTQNGLCTMRQPNGWPKFPSDGMARMVRDFQSQDDSLRNVHIEAISEVFLEAKLLIDVETWL